jgi:hypothetical protein
MVVYYLPTEMLNIARSIRLRRPRILRVVDGMPV